MTREEAINVMSKYTDTESGISKVVAEAHEMAIKALEQESCDDCISRQAAIDAIEFGITYAKAINKETGEVKELFQKSNDELRKATERIKQLPAIEPRKTGHWIDLRCDQCGQVDMSKPNYCPSCGAKMEET